MSAVKRRVRQPPKTLKVKGQFDSTDAMKPIKAKDYADLITEFKQYILAPRTYDVSKIIYLCRDWLKSWAHMILDHNRQDIRFYSFWARLSTSKVNITAWRPFVTYIQESETWYNYLNCQFLFFLRKKNRRTPDGISRKRFGFWLNNEWKFFLKDHFRSVLPKWERQTAHQVTSPDQITELIDNQDYDSPPVINYTYWRDLPPYLINALEGEYTIPNQTEIFNEVLTKYDNQDKKGID